MSIIQPYIQIFLYVLLYNWYATLTIIDKVKFHFHLAESVVWDTWWKSKIPLFVAIRKSKMSSQFFFFFKFDVFLVRITVMVDNVLKKSLPFEYPKYPLTNIYNHTYMIINNVLICLSIFNERAYATQPKILSR